MPATAADVVEVTGWQNARGPFVGPRSIGGLAISGTAEVDRSKSARVNMNMSCTDRGTTMALGISNGELDIQTKQVEHRERHYGLDFDKPDSVYVTESRLFQVRTRADEGEIIESEVTPESTKRFTIHGHLEIHVIEAFLYIGFSANGSDVNLKIPLKDPTVRPFLLACNYALRTKAIGPNCAVDLVQFDDAGIESARIPFSVRHLKKVPTEGTAGGITWQEVEISGDDTYTGGGGWVIKSDLESKRTKCR
jgi:hypothetical protein